VKRGIRLRGISGPTKGKVWQSDQLLRAGRLAALEIVLDDSSVSRKHAEVRLTEAGDWVVQDLDSTNGTYVNGTRVPPRQDQPVKARDIVQFGKVALMVEMSEPAEGNGPPSDQLVLAASLSASASSVSPSRQPFDRDKMPRAGEQLIALLRAGHHLVHLQSEDQLLDSILNDAVSVLDAQRGAIVLAEGDTPEPQLKLRALAVGPGEPSNRFPFSKRLTQRAFTAGESMLFTNLHETEDFKQMQSIADGAMASVLCVLLRTPRRKIGVLHLDRGFFQLPFTEADLHLADALAAHVSVGIECAHLLRKQRDLFQKTIMALANLVELRDEYTGNHTQRVTRYATLLAEKLELPADQIEWVRVGTPLHDIGKIGISDVILRAPRRLTAAEFAEMQTHTTLGAEYLRGIPELHPIIPIVRHHHERWDGTGYPDRLGGEEIPLIARIVAVADAFDAITSNRPYHEGKRGKPPELAFAEVAKQSGRQFDPRCAQAFLDIRDEVILAMYELMPESGRDGLNPGGAPTRANMSTAEPVPVVTGDSVAEIQVG
jgi:putative nucleotidyltransferase with HDIG domain